MRKGLLKVMIANLIGLVISVVTNFLIPKYVSVDSYSLIKTYALYLTYAGFFSIGYNDGMYLKYGGKNLDQINKKELADNFFNYSILIILMQLFVLAVGLFLNDNIVIAFSFGIISYNILGYLKSLYQATGEFGAYSRALNIEKVSVFIFNLILIYIIKSDNYLWYIWIQVIIGLVVTVILLLKLETKVRFLKLGSLNMNEYKENISSGIILMLGNFSSSIFTGLDRWFVKILLLSFDFAMYSFAVSMENIINVFVSPITVSMYNYFCKKPSLNEIKSVKKLSLIWGFVVISAAFPAKWILVHYLNTYLAANDVIFLLFGAQVFYIVVKSIYVNLYKAEKQQNIYLQQMVVMIVLGAVLNALFFAVYNSTISIAFATFCTSIIWMLICEYKDKELRFSNKEYLSLFVIMGTYCFCGYKLSPILGLCVYVAVTVIVCYFFMKETVFFVVKNIMYYLNKVKKQLSRI